MPFGSVGIPAIYPDRRAIVELKTTMGTLHPFAMSSRMTAICAFRPKTGAEAAGSDSTQIKCLRRGAMLLPTAS